MHCRVRYLLDFDLKIRSGQVWELSDPPMLLVSHSREPDTLWHTKPYRSCQAQSQSTQLCPFHDYGIKKQPDITMGDFWVFCFNQLQCLLRPRDFRWFKILRRTFPGQLSGCATKKHSAEKHSAEKHTAHKHSAEKHTAKKQLEKISIQQKSIQQKSILHKGS